MRQRVMIAMAIANDPEVLIADEPTTALDVTVQAQILEVIQRIQSELSTAVVFITHDLGVVARVADRVQVMYAGRAAERGEVHDIFARPDASLHPGPARARCPTLGRERLTPIPGAPPNMLRPPSGCAFRTRCPHAAEVCAVEPPPELRPFGDGRDGVRPGRGARTVEAVSSGERGPRGHRPRQGLHRPHGRARASSRRSTRCRPSRACRSGVDAGETLGLVGESGSGKTTVGRCVLRLIEPTSGSVKFKGTELTTMRRERAAQAPPRDADRLPGPVRVARPAHHRRCARSPSRWRSRRSPATTRKRVAELLELVGLAPDHAKRFPHEFSGGQRQRIGIARALALNPSLIVLDEPVSALDVSIQAGVVNLLEDLQDQLRLSYLFIAHDLSVVRHISDTVAVMYLGKLMEIAPAEDIYNRRRTRTRRRCCRRSPSPTRCTERERKRIVLDGEVPSPINPPSGCRFRTRCPKAQERLRRRGARRWSTEARSPRGVPLPRRGRRVDLRRRLGDVRRARVGWLTVRDVIIYLTLVINVVSMVGMIAGVLLHSGRGGGLSDMFGGAGGAALGSTAAERNLNRITFVFALIWVITVVALGFLLVGTSTVGGIVRQPHVGVAEWQTR